MPTAIEQLVATMTVADLAAAVGLEVEDVVRLVLERRGAARHGARQPTSGGASRQSRRAAEPVVADPAGNKYERARAYTAAVRDAIVAAGGPLSASELRSKVGGNATRCGLALRRLIDEGTIVHDGGSTSARRYRVAAR